MKIKEAKTPFIDENLLPDPQLCRADASSGIHPAKQSGASPGVTEETYERGELAGQASSIPMSILYTARLARFDLLRPVCALASCVTRWTLQ